MMQRPQPANNKPQCNSGPSRLEGIAGGIASEYAECSICFEPLCDQPCAMLHCRGKRVCRHLIHQSCGQAMQRSGQHNCPECRGRFDELRSLPRLTDTNTREWFAAVDVDGDGRLDRNEVVSVLKAQYRLDWRKLEQHIDSLWTRWDTNASGDLAYEELFAKDGLISYIRGGTVARQFQVKVVPRGAPPPLSNTQAWFRYWDEDGNGTLDIQEVQRALMKTFRLGDDGGMHRVNTMRETLDAVWPLFDHDGNGEIDFEEFTASNGLGETLAVSVQAMELSSQHSAMRRTSNAVLQIF